MFYYNLCSTYWYTNGPTSLKTGFAPLRNLLGFVTLKKYSFKYGLIGGFFHTSTIFDPSLSGISCKIKNTKIIFKYRTVSNYTKTSYEVEEGWEI